MLTSKSLRFRFLRSVSRYQETDATPRWAVAIKAVSERGVQLRMQIARFAK